VGGFVFSWYLFPHLLDHRKAMCTGVGAIYLASFLLMCWQVREGDYPPPPSPPGQDARFNPLKTLVIYFRECLSVPLYRDYLILYALLTAASTCASPFIVLFARDTLQLSMNDIGKIFAWSAAASAILYVPMGYLCDKLSPIRVAFASLFGFVIAAAYTLLFVHDKTGWLLYQVAIFMVPSVAWNLGQTALTMYLFPSEKFGQLSSSLSVLGYGSIILGNYLAGRFMDFFDSNYRLIFAWSLFWYAASIVPMLMVYRHWKRCGGPDHYVPPLPQANDDGGTIIL
jgi:MFS family permease